MDTPWKPLIAFRVLNMAYNADFSVRHKLSVVCGYIGYIPLLKRPSLLLVAELVSGVRFTRVLSMVSKKQDP